MTTNFKVYHFENFTFSRSRDEFTGRSHSLLASFYFGHSPKPTPSKAQYPSSSALSNLDFQQPFLRESEPAYLRQSSKEHPVARNRKHVSFAPVSMGSRHEQSNFAPPPGPPPTSSHSTIEPQAHAYASPQGPPPSSANEGQPPPYHDWTVIPDTALLPPPPGFPTQIVPRLNASSNDAAHGRAWTNENRLWPPRDITDRDRQALSIGFASLIRPREFIGNLRSNPKRPGVWQVQTKRQCGDACLLSTIPMYSSAYASSPEKHGRRIEGYFEIKINEIERDAAVAIGFVAPPYPTWRLPGWERASLGVHGDDGRRYVNDNDSGTDSVKPFERGDCVGIGIEFGDTREPPDYSKKAQTIVKRDAIVFFTRNGKKEFQWDLHEEVDEDMHQPGGVNGLEGDRDLHAAIGVSGAMDFSIQFGRHNWMYKPQE